MPRIQPELVQPQAQPRPGEQTPTNQARVNVKNGNQTPILPQEVHIVPIRAEARNTMPLRTPNQDVKSQLAQVWHAIG